MERHGDRTGDVSVNMFDTSGDNDEMKNEKTRYNTRYNCDHLTHYDFNATWSLQDAIATALEKFLDKSKTINFWQFNTNIIKKIEQQKRQKMKQYAINDCSAVAELFFHMYPEKSDDHQISETSSTTSTNIGMNLDDDLSNISEDELIDVLRPKFNKQESILPSQNNKPPVLTVTTTQQEIDEFNSIEQQLAQQQAKLYQKLKTNVVKI